ncbi:MAG: hypothetical protein ACKO5E_05715, partial [bacterium]
LDDDQPTMPAAASAEPGPKVDSSHAEAEKPAEVVRQQEAEPVIHVEESREPFILGFHESIKGLPLELGPHTKVTLVYASSREWLLATDQSGLLQLAAVDSADQPVVETPCPLFENHRWAAFDARTCDQTGNVIWLGICRTTGDLYVSVEINDAFTGKRIEPLKIGSAADLGLPANPGRIKAMQLTDWFGRGRLEALLQVSPEREPGGTSLFLLERRGDSILQGYLPLQLADSDADRLLAGGAGNRLLHVAWAGSGSDQLLQLDEKGNLNLLTNFGGALPPGTGKPRHVSRANGTPAVIAGGLSCLSWVKHYAGRPGRMVMVDSLGHIGIADVGPVSTLAESKQVVTRGISELVFGPDAVVTATDWDNDGGLDLVVGDSAGGLTLYKDRGTPGSPAMGSPERLESGGLPFIVPNRDSRRHANLDPGPPRHSCPVLNDWTAHQRFDVLVTDARGAVWYMRNNGAKTQPRLDFADRVSCEGKPLFVAPRSQLAVAHWKGGAEPDVIGFDAEGHLACWPRKDKMELGTPEKLTDVRKRPIALGGRGRRAGLVHLWAGAWTVPGAVEIIVSVPKFAAGRLADWLEISVDKPLEEFPLFWLLQKQDDGLTARPLRTKNAELLHNRVPGEARSYSVSGVLLGGRKLPDLLVVPEKGKGMIWPRETLRWD